MIQIGWRTLKEKQLDIDGLHFLVNLKDTDHVSKIQGVFVDCTYPGIC